MNWEKIYKVVLKRGKNHIHYLKLWSSFNSQQINIMMMNEHGLNNLMVLDLRGTNYDISNLFKMNTDKEKVKLIKGKEIKNDDNNDDNNNNDNDDDNNNDNDNEDNNDNNDSNNEEEKEKKRDDNKEKANDKGKQKVEKEVKESDNKEKIENKYTKNDTNDEKKNQNNTDDIPKKESFAFIDSLPQLKYLYIYGCKNVTVENIEKVQQQWKTIKLDVKICQECHDITRICPDKKLTSDPTVIEKISHCSVCKKEHCDQCHPLWTCEVCGGELTCHDCRAHGIKCTNCDCDYCYFCNQPKKILQCRYCHRMSCGQSTQCQNLGYLYKACSKCDYYVCNTCQKDQDHLITCSGEHCAKSFCKTCINETTNNSLISFDKEEVEKRVRENNFALCSYCNTLYCTSCIDSISFYVGSKDLPYCIILCKECEIFYKTQLINLFKIPQFITPNYSSSSNERYQNNASIHTSSPTNNLIDITQSNLLTSNTLSIDSPIDIFNYDQYIR